MGKEAEALASFLEPRLGLKLSRSDSTLELAPGPEEAAPATRLVKTYIKRFLHNAGIRKQFRVIADEDGLRIVELGKASGEEAA